MKKYILPIVLVLLAGALFSGCATQSFQNLGNPPGFIKGILHGFILMFSFVASLFTDYEIYAFPNSGGWYDFGFLIGVMLFFGGGGAGAKCKA
jgi:hypothetical protein